MFTKWNDFPIWACFTDGGGDPPAGDPPKDPPAVPPKDPDGGGKEPGKGDPPKDDKIVFPDQATFMSRVDRESKKQLEETARQLGYESVDQMKAAAKAAKEAAEKNKSDLEKEKERADKLEQEKSQVVEAANSRLVNAELKMAAVQAGVVDPDAAVQLANRSEITVGEDGSVTGAKEAIDALVKEKTYLVGKPNKGVGSPGSPGGDPGGLSEEEEGKRIAEERRKAREQKSTGVDPWAN